ncbi:MAG TPA: VOC family protein [Opitutaceae bacterium]|nr:VOC family protein [Opitutaceae bacterium]
MSADSPSVSSLGQVAVTVSDVAKAKQFYHGVLGLKSLFDAGPNLSFLGAGDVRLMLTLPQGAGAIGQNSVLYFRTAQLESAYPAMLARGAEGERPPQLTAKMPDHELWMAFVRDPDGNLIGLMEERR